MIEVFIELEEVAVFRGNYLTDTPGRHPISSKNTIHGTPLSRCIHVKYKTNKSRTTKYTVLLIFSYDEHFTGSVKTGIV